MNFKIFINKIIKKLLIIFYLIIFLGLPGLCLAKKEGSEKPSDFGLSQTAEKAYGTLPKQTDPTVIIGTIIGVILSSLGIIFMLQIIVAGIKWLVAAGNEEKITAAKKTLIHSLIGLVIVLSAYTIVYFAMGKILFPAIGI